MRKVLLALLLSAPAMAGIGDPWYLAFKVSDGDLVQYRGPYSSRIECMGGRWRLPLGAEFIGCFQ